MSTVQPKAKPKKNKRRWQRRLNLVIMIFVLPIAFLRASYLGLRWWGDSHLEAAFAETDRLDPGWRLKEIEANRLFPLSDKNGYHHVGRIKAAMPTGDWPEWPFPQFDQDPDYLHTVRSAIHNCLVGDRTPSTLLNAEASRVLRAEITRAATAVELARRMPDYPYGRALVEWMKDASSRQMTGEADYRAVAFLLMYDARLRAEDNDLEGALHDVKALLFVSRSLGDDPRPESSSIREGCDSLACRVLERCLAFGRVSEKALVDLQREFEREAEVPFYLLGVRGQRALCDLQLENIQNGEVSIEKFYRMDVEDNSSYLSWSRLPGEASPSALQKNLEFVRKFASIRDERVKILRFMNEEVEFGKLPTWEKIRATEAKAKSLASEHSSQRGLSLVFSEFAKSEARLLASIRVSYTGMAIERFHLAHGRWPEHLQDLVPQFLSAVPLDPFDGAPLRIVRSGSDVVVYSISQDGEDQGVMLLDDPTDPGSGLGFVLHDPSQRRRPAKPFEFPPRTPVEPPDPDDKDK
jgi:hypothetical protein